MAHIHTAPGQHDLTVSAYIIRTDFDQPKILLHKHKKLNTLLQFGGHVELDENPWDTMTHEIKEETGYSMEQLKLLQPADRILELKHSALHPQPFYVNTHPIDTGELEGKHYHIDVGYAFVTDEEPADPPAEDESTDIQMFTAEELQKLNETDIWPDTVTICLHALNTCLPNWERVSTTPS